MELASGKVIFASLPYFLWEREVEPETLFRLQYLASRIIFAYNHRKIMVKTP